MNNINPLINCAAYRAGHKLRDITIDEISDVLLEPDTFVWVGLLEPDPDVLSKIQEEFGLHDLAVEDARNAHQRPKLEEYGETLFVVLHTVHLNQEAIQYGETHLFLGARFVVSVRHGPSLGYAKLRARAESMPARLASGPGFVLYSIFDFIVDQYQPCIDHLQRRFRLLEVDLFKPGSNSDPLEDFYKMKDEVLSLQSAAVPLTDICNQLLRFHNDLIPKENRIYYRDILDHVARVTQSADRIREMINAAMQVCLAQVTIRQNEVVKRLAGWGAILAIPTMVFSLYGMNFEHMPELKWKWSYPILLVTTFVACVVLFKRLKRVGWL